MNRIRMLIPACRGIIKRLSDMDWNTSQQNLLNWTDKGVIQLNKLIPTLKKITLQDSAFSSQQIRMRTEANL
nr:hypothetical protein [Bacteroides caecigallinarum]